MWGILKEILVELSGVSKDALHVHIGLIAFFGSAFLMKRPVASVLPLFWVWSSGTSSWTCSSCATGHRGSRNGVRACATWPTPCSGRASSCSQHEPASAGKRCVGQDIL